MKSRSKTNAHDQQKPADQIFTLENTTFFERRAPVQNNSTTGHSSMLTKRKPSTSTSRKRCIFATLQGHNSTMLPTVNMAADQELTILDSNPEMPTKKQQTMNACC
jgi:hypothetical protein